MKQPKWLRVVYCWILYVLPTLKMISFHYPCVHWLWSRYAFVHLQDSINERIREYQNLGNTASIQPGSLWLVLGQWTQLAFHSSEWKLKASCINTVVTPVQCMGNHIGQLHLNTWYLPEFNQPTQLNIDRKLTKMTLYSGWAVSFEIVQTYFDTKCLAKLEGRKWLVRSKADDTTSKSLDLPSHQ